MEFNEYEKIIIRDVKNTNYSRDLKIVKITFAIVCAVFIAIYFLGFHSDILKVIKSIINIYRDSIVSMDYEFKAMVYSFNKMIAFVLFLAIFAIFIIFALFAYDIAARNKVIKYYEDKSSD
jgi:hypothetical protein